jgi:hypothetical protein
VTEHGPEFERGNLKFGLALLVLALVLGGLIALIAVVVVY